MPRDEEFRAKEKKFHKMTRDGLVERGAASGEETRISGREQDFDLRQARDSPDSLEDLSAKARHTRQQRPKDGDTPAGGTGGKWGGFPFGGFAATVP